MGYEGEGFDWDSDAMHGFDADNYEPAPFPDFFLAHRAGMTVEQYRRHAQHEQAVALSQEHDAEFGPLVADVATIPTVTVTDIPDDINEAA